MTCISICGDGLIILNEECDDFNMIDGDGCSSACQLEIGFLCIRAGFACIPKCGDGIQVKGEGCDDGNSTSGDGCDSTCITEKGFYCPIAN